jgi:transposase-like protein
MKSPTTLIEATRYFADYDNCHQFLVEMRWPDGKVTCPQCGSERVIYMQNVRRFKCYEKHPKAQFTLKTGTIFEDSPLGLDKWLVALWLIVNCKNGISSCEIARDLGITQKSAWFMAHRLRLALQHGSFGKLSGDVEVDETFIGGKARNMHVAQRKRRSLEPAPKTRLLCSACWNVAAR